jgi:hypothetical protein
MPLQRERLPPWTLSFLDDAKGDSSFDACSFYTLVLYGDRAAVCAISDEWQARYDEDGPYRYRQPYLDRLGALAWSLWAEIPEDLRYGIVITAILDLQLHIRDHAEWLADSAITDACEGGNLTPWKRPPRAGLYGAWYPGRRAQRRLNSPRFMRDYARRWLQGDYHALRDKIRRYARTTVARGQNWHEIDLRIGELIEAQRPSTMPEPAWRHALTRRVAAATGAKIRPLRGRARKRNRKPLIKAATFAADLIGPRAVGAFIRGEVVDLRGRELTFHVKRARSLYWNDHGCLSIGVSATDGPRLGTLCWYVEATPTLDQLAAIALHVESGSEREILAISNMTTITSDGVGHPLVMERMASTIDVIRDGIAHGARPEQGLRPRANPAYPRGRPPGRNMIDPYTLRRERRAQYWAATGPKWVEAVALIVAGPRAPKLLSGRLMAVA